MKNERVNKILSFIKEHPSLSSKEIHDGVGLGISYTTLKRELAELMANGFIDMRGQGRSSKYIISFSFDFLFPVSIDEYFKKEIDEREIKENYNFDLISVLEDIALFSSQEMDKLNALQQQFQENISKISPAQYKKDMERLAIDLSWKSSQIEGNTYSLLETEQLLMEKKTAAGKTKDEATMLLNHKEALDFISTNPHYLRPLTVAKIENIHSILVKELDVDRNIRVRRVGITGTNYKPLDNEFQIREALEDVCELINNRDNIFERALLLLVLISYIQPFNDGNKRTARIVSNAELIANNYCPISFRTIDSVEYKMAMLLFYEQNNISVFKKIFIDQFEFAVTTYF